MTPWGLLEPDARTTGTSGSEGGGASQGAPPTRQGLWASLKAVELANLTSPTLAKVINQARRGIERVRRTPHLATHSCATPACGRMIHRRSTDPFLVERAGLDPGLRSPRYATMAEPLCEERVGEGLGSAQERTALRDALLRDLDLSGQPLATRRELRLQVWLHRRHLSWLLLPWYLVRVAWWFFLSGERRAAVASEDCVIDLYRQASGMDRQAAGDQVWPLEGQLAPLVDRPELVGLEQTAEPPGANRAELEAAMDALLAYALAGRRTDDELLGAVLALWAESEDSMVHGHERLVEQGVTRRRTQERVIVAEAEAWRVRYRLAWRRWFDRQAEQGSATNPGGW